MIGSEIPGAVPLALHDGPDPRWQESMFVAWYDAERGIGGVHRVGHEVGARRANTWGGLVTATGLRWRKVEHGCPLTAANRTPQRFAAGATAFRAEGARTVEVADGDVDVWLELEDLYPASGIWESGAAADVLQTVAPNHLESSGRVHGVVRLGDRHFEVDGLFHRDHSWGPRDWSNIISHRWVVGTFRPDLSFSCVTVQGPGHRYVRSAAVVRDGVVIPADDVDIVVWMEPDAVSHRGGEVTLRLRNGHASSALRGHRRRRRPPG